MQGIVRRQTGEFMSKAPHEAPRCWPSRLGEDTEVQEVRKVFESDGQAGLPCADSAKMPDNQWSPKLESQSGLQDPMGGQISQILAWSLEHDNCSEGILL